MPQERLSKQILLATPTGKRPRGRPRIMWREYISNFSWSRLGVEPAEQSEIAENTEVFQVPLGMLPRRRSSEEKRVWKCVNVNL